MDHHPEALASTPKAVGDAPATRFGARVHDLSVRRLRTPAPRTAAYAELRRREATFRRAVVLADVLAIAVSGCLALYVGQHASLTWGSLLALPVVILLAKVLGLYERDDLVVHKSTMDEAPRLLQLGLFAAVALWVMDTVTTQGYMDKRTVLSLASGFVIACVLTRASARRIASRVLTAERCLVIGDAVVVDRLREKLAAQRGVQLVGSVPVERVRGDMLELHNVVDEREVHRLILAPSTTSGYEATLDLVRAAKVTGVRVSILPSMLEVVGSSVVFDDVHGLTLLGVRRFGLSRSSRMLKRSFDLAGACAGLLVAGPFMAVTALAIRLTSPGPVFYRQTRIGRDGQHFEILKFRTMIDGAHDLREQLAALNEADGLFKIADDPRVTKVGRLLRRSSLDELPQLFNVLRGEMSLVGPRPLVEDEDGKIKGLDRRRLHLTPGMTGHWQVLGSARVPLSEMVKIDYLYVAGWSLWSDVKILLRTIPYMLGARGQ